MLGQEQAVAANTRLRVQDRPRFDVDALRDLAGEGAFAHGEAYYSARQVQILALEPDRVLAQVSGSEDYRTELTGRGADIDGECSCPAFDDRGFCKHMVAAALAANAAGSGAEAEGAGTLSRIRDHLKAKGIDALVDVIMDIAERDPAMLRKLDLAASAVDAEDEILQARLRKAVDGATRTRGFIDYGEARSWAADVDAVLDSVADIVSSGRAGLALKLVEHAIDRIEGAIEEIDDSDGYCGDLLDRARDIHIAAARAAARSRDVRSRPFRQGDGRQSRLCGSGGAH